VIQSINEQLEKDQDVDPIIPISTVVKEFLQDFIF
jgi:hypothetical protein